METPANCIDGAMNCQPEDSGGQSGFYEKLRVMKDKKYPDYKDTLLWMGKYDAEKFDLNKTNKKLMRILLP